MKNVSEGTKLFYFLLYTVLYEGMIWGMFMYLIMYQNWSEWTVIIAIIMSSAQFQPRHFGIEVKEKNPLDLDEDEFLQWEKINKMRIKEKEIDLELQVQAAKN